VHVEGRLAAFGDRPPAQRAAIEQRLEACLARRLPRGGCCIDTTIGQNRRCQRGTSKEITSLHGGRRYPGHVGAARRRNPRVVGALATRSASPPSSSPPLRATNATDPSASSTTISGGWAMCHVAVSPVRETFHAASTASSSSAVTPT